MNANGTSNGTTQRSTPPASAGGAASREKIIFPPNEGVAVELEHDAHEARECDGNWGPQFQYKLGGNRITWMEPAAHAELVRQQARAGEQFWITKRKIGRAVKWVAERIEEQGDAQETPAPPPTSRAAAPAPAEKPAATPPPPRYSRDDLARDQAQAQAARTPAPTPPREADTDKVSGNIMAAALRSAIDASAEAIAYAEARGLGTMTLRIEDVRALAITIYIQMWAGNKKK